jgi:hypothetical protein
MIASSGIHGTQSRRDTTSALDAPEADFSSPTGGLVGDFSRKNARAWSDSARRFH